MMRIILFTSTSCNNIVVKYLIFKCLWLSGVVPCHTDCYQQRRYPGLCCQDCVWGTADPWLSWEHGQSWWLCPGRVWKSYCWRSSLEVQGLCVICIFHLISFVCNKNSDQSFWSHTVWFQCHYLGGNVLMGINWTRTWPPSNEASYCSSVGRASHRYRRGDGFKSCWSLRISSGLSLLLL